MPQLHTVHILLATYNGERFLSKQLESIVQQSYRNWTVTISDDGSTDETLIIVERFARQVQQPVFVLQGPKNGCSTANFFHLVSKAPIVNNVDLYAFCDQDDIWHDDKLERAVKWHMQHLDKNVRLYCGRTEYISVNLQSLGLSPSINQLPSFGNALVQNIASGNTMVFNYPVLISLKKVLPEHSIWHDWTTYVVATALEGFVYFDDEPCVYYRQHESNVIGKNNGFLAQLKRLPFLFNGRYRKWSNLTEQCINDIHEELSKNSLSIFQDFKDMRSAPSFISRIKKFKNSNIRRQNISSNILLVVALIFGLA